MATEAGGMDALLDELRGVLAEQRGVGPAEISDAELDAYLREHGLLEHASRTASLLDRAEREPDAPALIGDDGLFSCADLAAMARSTAAALASRAFPVEAICAVELDGTGHQLAAAVGVLASGASLLPVEATDPQAPELAASARAVAVCVARARRARWGDGPWPWLEGSSDTAGASPFGSAPARERLAIVAPTRDELVMQERRAIDLRLSWLDGSFGVDAGERVLAVGGDAADDLVIGALWPLSRDGVAIVTHCDPLDADALAALLRDRAVRTLVTSTESVVALLSSWSSPDSPLRRVICRAPSLPRELVDDVRRRLGASMHSIFGAAEACAEIAANLDPAPPGSRGASPAGGPAAHAAFVLDEHLELVPAGVTGRLFVAGPAIARGYLGSPGSTGTRFVESVFDDAGPTMVHTGDLAHRLDDGSLVIDGNSDRVVWRKGRRVWLPGIEARLVDGAGVLDAAAALAGSHLLGYVVCAPGVSVESLRSDLSSIVDELALVSAIPLDAEGDPDEHRLARVPIVDEREAARVEETIRSSSEARAVRVRVVPHRSPEPLVYVGARTQPSGPAPARLSSETEEPTTSRRKAICDGGALDAAEPAPRTLAELLRAAAARVTPTEIACIEEDGTEVRLTAAELLERASAVAARLREAGVTPGTFVALQIARRSDFLVGLWACLLAASVPVPLACVGAEAKAAAAAAKLVDACTTFGVRSVLAGDGAIAAVNAVLGEVKVEVIGLGEPPQRRDAPPPPEPDPDDPAILFLTSGSTGKPKGVPLSHANVIAGIRGTAQKNGFSSADVNLNWMPMDHVGSIVAHHMMLLHLGAKQIHGATELVLRDPLQWVEWMSRFRATITWSPNFGYSLVCARAAELRSRGYDLSPMRFIVNAGETVVPKTALEFMRLLRPLGLQPSAMRPTFGMSETASGITMSAGMAEEEAQAVYAGLGEPIPGVALRIVDASGSVVDEGVVGRLQVRGAPVFRGYHGDTAANAELFSDDGWFTTGDLGMLVDGALTLTGRERDVIVINGVKYNAHEIEAIAAEVEGIDATLVAACPVRPLGAETDELALFLAGDAASEETLRLVEPVRSAISARLGIRAEHVVPLSPDEFPRTGIGKIQRSELSRNFLAGAFDERVRRIDVGTANPRTTVPSWFFEPVWVRRRLPQRSRRLQDRALLVFCGEDPAAEAFCRAAEGEGAKVTRVLSGDEFVSNGTTIHLRPGEAADYRRLVAATRADSIIHLWTADPVGRGDMHERGILGIVHLARALAGEPRAQPARLWVVSRLVQRAHAEDRVRPAHATLPGFLRTLDRELPWLTVRHVDLPDGEVDVAATLLSELGARDAEDAVAYRRGHRLVQRLRRLPVEMPNDGRLESGGLYLVTGGLGGVGTALCRFLLEHVRARLLVVGRSRLDEDDPRLAALRRLGEIRYERADVCEPDALRAAVRAAERSFGRRLSGVFHLAGVAEPRPVLEETPESLLRTLAPKVDGTRAVHEIAAERGAALVVTFSSVNGFFGGSGNAAYSAASSFCSGFAAAFARAAATSGPSSPTRSVCIQWSLWEDLGLGRLANAAAAKTAGFHALAAPQAMSSLMVALGTGRTDLLVGLDAASPNVSRWCLGEPLGTQRLAAIVEPPAALAAVSRRDWRDHHGRAHDCAWIGVEELPRTPDGQLDEAALQLLARGSEGKAKGVPPRNDVERRLARIWQRVLGLPGSAIGVTDDFFVLGGHSLLLARVDAEIASEFGRSVPLSELMRCSTIAGLAELLAGEGEDGALGVARLTAGDGPALFFVHDASGDVTSYEVLCRHLDAARACFGLPSRMSLESATPVTVEALARDCADRIQSTGAPVHALLGWSFGGVVAFETTRALLERGVRVPALVLIDAVLAPAGLGSRVTASAAAALWLSQRAARAGVPTPPWEPAWDALAGEPLARALRERAVAAGLLPSRLDSSALHQLLERFRAHLSAWVQYRPVPAAVRALLIQPDASLPADAARTLAAWRELVGSGVEVASVAGTHGAMLADPFVERVATVVDGFVASAPPAAQGAEDG